MNLITLHRIQAALHRQGVPFLPKVIRRIIFLVFNSSVPESVEIGQGSKFGYGGMGVVIHRRCRIGDRVFISPQVTIGGRSAHREVPTIGDDVFIAPGARVIGPITVGPRSVIGANAVVLNDVPPDTIVAGVPARVIKANDRPLWWEEAAAIWGR
jgi:serine O-acetyltransferase